VLAKYPPPFGEGYFVLLGKGVTQQDYSVVVVSIVEGNGSASISFVAVVKVSNTVEDLYSRFATSLSKELSNTVSS